MSFGLPGTGRKDGRSWDKAKLSTGAERQVGWLPKFIPMRVRRWLGFGSPWEWMRGDYPTWAEARRASAGYDDETLVKRVRQAARAVRAGEAAWERDGTLFAKPKQHRPLLSVLCAIAKSESGRLEVVDFGGALGSGWWQHRHELAEAGKVRWRVVEQSALVEVGREFEDETLSFHSTLAEACVGNDASVCLLSSVLQYVEDPSAVLAEVMRHRFRHVVLDRTPFVAAAQNRLVVQHTPPELGGGSYPCWLFSRAELLAPLATEYKCMEEWPVEFDRIHPEIDFRGLYFRRFPASEIVPKSSA